MATNVLRHLPRAQQSPAGLWTRTSSHILRPTRPTRPTTTTLPTTTATAGTASRRTFFPSPFSSAPPKQTLTASRTLPYPSSAIYAIIADVDSYAHFLPFCERSTVTRWSQPDAVQKKRWPSEAELVIGWKGVTETFRSDIFCVPGRIVEAVGGDDGKARTTIPRGEIGHHEDSMPLSSSSGGGSRSRHSDVLSHLLTRWTVEEAKPRGGGTHDEGGGGRNRAAGGESTDVHLAIEFQFANPLYSAMSGAVVDKVAGYMIEAFEARVKALLKDGGSKALL